MLSSQQQEKYQRHLLLDGFSGEQQMALSNSRVLVVGAGGLGSPVLQYLAGAGVGTLGIVEFDTLESSNLHRQVLYTAANLGEKKGARAVQRLSAMNPDIEVRLHDTAWTDESAKDIAPGYDILVDCSDNLPTRYITNRISLALGLPFVYGAVHQMEGQVAVFNYKGSKSYSVLFPEETPPPAKKPIGVLGPVPGIIGSCQAAEVIKIITGLGEVLANQILYISVRTNRWRVMSY